MFQCFRFFSCKNQSISFVHQNCCCAVLCNALTYIYSIIFMSYIYISSSFLTWFLLLFRKPNKTMCTLRNEVKHTRPRTRNTTPVSVCVCVTLTAHTPHFLGLRPASDAIILRRSLDYCSVQLRRRTKKKYIRRHYRPALAKCSWLCVVCRWVIRNGTNNKNFLAIKI